jgi:DNA-binding NtrC family response regulator
VILASYEWPGNVRQLQNVIRNIVVLHNGEEVLKEHLPPPVDTALSEIDVISRTQEIKLQSAAIKGPEDHPEDHSVVPLAEVERQAIEQAIALCEGNVPRAAALLEVSPSTLYRKKQSWD